MGDYIQKWVDPAIPETSGERGRQKCVRRPDTLGDLHLAHLGLGLGLSAPKGPSLATWNFPCAKVAAWPFRPRRAPRVDVHTARRHRQAQTLDACFSPIVCVRVLPSGVSHCVARRTPAWQASAGPRNRLFGSRKRRGGLRLVLCFFFRPLHSSNLVDRVFHYKR